MIDFHTNPPRLSRNERVLLIVASGLTGLTRIWGRARSPWDWDEILFSLALRDYDVASHHPHPPGFPLFIATAKVFSFVGISEFHCLQVVSLIAGVLLVPAAFWLCRELRFNFTTSMTAALFLAFLPNVWFFGETAFSDVPSIVLVLFACALLLRGCRSGGAFLAGCALLAVAAGYRPQNLAIGIAPALIAAWHQIRDRRYARLLAGLAVGAAILFVSYGAAAWATGGWTRYSEAVRAHEQYLRTVDSFRNPNRPSLLRVAYTFFVRPYDAPIINFALALSAAWSVLVSGLRLRWSILIAIASFGPFCVAAWLVLDHFSASRFSIGYDPLIALLAADGAFLMAAAVGRIVKNEGARGWAQWFLSAALLVVMIAWTLPGIAVARRELSPPITAIQWIRENVDASKSTVYVHGSMGPYADYFLADYRLEYVEDNAPLAELKARDAWYLREGVTQMAGAHNFTWPRGRLWMLVRQRYFEVSATPMSGAADFREGWYEEESSGESAWRWMGKRSVTYLPRIDGPARLKIRLFIPIHAMSGHPVIEVHLNGVRLEKFHPEQGYVNRLYDVRAKENASNELVIISDRVVNPAAAGLGSDTRDLGVRLDDLQWFGVESK